MTVAGTYWEYRLRRRRQRVGTLLDPTTLAPDRRGGRPRERSFIALCYLPGEFVWGYKIGWGGR